MFGNGQHPNSLYALFLLVGLVYGHLHFPALVHSYIYMNTNKNNMNMKLMFKNNSTFNSNEIKTTNYG